MKKIKKESKLKNIIKNQKGFSLKVFVITISICLLIAYGLFNARSLILGPTIEIFNPLKDTETKKNVITVNGRAKNIAFISLNERPIFINTEGIFEEKLLLSPGSNVIEIKAKDRFKNETKETIKVYYKIDSQ
ncbi:MAG: hypothetical protein JW740_03105 [Candidatus Zambryskibacteria bacterium]|nr:hypothetical protein [Candidatus Zambryskibacteria bacterium]